MPVADATEVRTELDKILSSPLFAQSPRMSRFLSFVVEEALQDRSARIKEYVIATEVFDKPVDYDPNADSTVRTEATKLRAKLNRYYESEGREDHLVIEIPKGTYSPVFRPRIVAAVPSPPAISPERPIRRTPGVAVIGWCLAGLCAAAAIFLFVMQGGRPDDRPVLRFQIYPPPGVRVASLRVNGPAVISPDGRHLAFVGTSEQGGTQIWIRPLDSLSAYPLGGTEDASYLFWSPDSQRVGFFAGRKLKKVKLAGSGAEVLCDAPLGRGGAWSPKGIIVFTPASASPLLTVSEDGGTPQPLTTLRSEPKERAHLHPRLLPGGERFLYLGLLSALSGTHLSVSALGRPGYRAPVAAARDTESEVVYAQIAGRNPSGSLLYIRGSTLVAQPFDPEALASLGEPVPIAEGVRTGFERRIGDFSVSDTGVLVYRTVHAPANELVWLDRTGKRVQGKPGGGVSDRDVVLSPDNRMVAVVRIRSELEGADIWVRDLDRSAETRLTLDRAIDYTPVWSGDGRSLYFSSHQSDGFVLFRANVIERRPPERLYSSNDFFTVNDCSRDNATVVFQVRNSSGEYDLWSLETSGGRVRPILKTPFNELQAQFSPDGRWLAYSSDESGRPEVYIRAWTGGLGATTVQVSNNGGVQPRWRADGGQLFYIAPDGRLMAVAIAPGIPPKVVVPEGLFMTRIDAQSADARILFNYAVSLDGRKFLLPVSDQSDANIPWTVVTNWPAVAANSVRPPQPE